MAVKSIDKTFLTITTILICFGFIIFLSASYGLLAKESASFGKVVAGQLVFGLVLGTITAFVFSKIHYSKWRNVAFAFFVGAVLFSLAVFIPGIGFTHGGATRWIDLGITTMQPSELLKIVYVVYLSALLSRKKNSTTSPTFKQSVLPFLIVTGVVAFVLLLQKDTGTLMTMVGAGVAILIVTGTKFKHMAVLIPIAIVAFGLLVLARPYVKDRIVTFLSPERDLQNAGYQINQSMIAIGSGEITGRGFGKSFQKFRYLPEPMGDSIFSVAAEEFGFLGSITLIILFVSFYLRAIIITKRSPDLFGKLLVIGIASLFIVQSFMNIGAMTGVFPLTGIPLVFVSHGGTALFIALAGTGIILNVSRYAKKA